MIKKLLTVATLITISAITSNAQSFTFDVGNPLVANTSGDSELGMNHYLKNITSGNINITWSVFSENYPDASWELTSLCDNKLCYYSNGTPNQLAVGVEHISADVAPGAKSIFQAHFNVPAASANGTGICKVLVSVAPAVPDTMIFQINKTPTGISVIDLTDIRVSIYPNPASNNVMVYAEKSLNAANVSIVSITGQVVMNTALNTGIEKHDININSLSKGTYLVRLTDNKGQIITSRKFIKE